MKEVEIYDVVIRILSAALCGGLLGWEREVSDKPAGLRTNMLVAIGASTAALAALQLYHAIADTYPGKVVSADPVRIVSGVIGGLGFLGAGAIIQSQGQVQGMTTAATIWVVGGIGVACGLGNYLLAVTTVIVTFLVLYVIGKFEVSSLAPEPLQKNNRKPDKSKEKL